MWGNVGVELLTIPELSPVLRERQVLCNAIVNFYLSSQSQPGNGKRLEMAFDFKGRRGVETKTSNFPPCNSRKMY
jgi:hypothetical protein